MGLTSYFIDSPAVFEPSAQKAAENERAFGAPFLSMARTADSSADCDVHSLTLGNRLT